LKQLNAENNVSEIRRTKPLLLIHSLELGDDNFETKMRLHMLKVLVVWLDWKEDPT
jgi:hypothetical protein